MSQGYVDPMLFMGLIGQAAARNSRDIWYSDGTPKTEADLYRVPWVRKAINAELHGRYAYSKARGVVPFAFRSH